MNANLRITDAALNAGQGATAAAITGSPTLAGTASVGQTLTPTWPTVSLGTPEGEALYLIQGYDGTSYTTLDSSGSEIASYVIQSADLGLQIRALVRAWNSATAVGSEPQAVSDLTAAVAAPEESTLSIVNSGTTGTMTILSSGPTSLTVDWSGFSGDYAVWDGGYTINLTAPGPYILYATQALDDGTPAEGETLTSVLPFVMADEAAGTATFAYQWYVDGVAVSGATSSSWTVDTDGLGGDVTLIVTVTQGALDPVTSESAAVTIAATPTLTVARIGDFQSSSTLTASPSFTVDLTGYNTGDEIVFFYGPNIFATAATVGGAAATKLNTDDASYSTGGRVSAFSHTLTSPGGPGTVIALTCTAAVNAHVFSCHGIKGGAVSNSARGYHGSGAAVTLSLPIAASGSAALAALIGNPGGQPTTWTNVTLIAQGDMPVAGGNKSISIADATGLSAGTLSVTGDPTSGTDRFGLFAVAIQPS